jgi:hypothetical protein
MRDSGLPEGLLALLAALLIVAALAGLVRHGSRTRSLGRSASTGARLGVTGLGVLAVAGLAQAFVFDQSFSAMPYLVLSGMAAVASGVVLVGVALIRTRLLPGWTGALLVLGALAMLGSNEQTALVLLLVPFGVAWMAVGYALWTRGTAD